MLKKILKGMRHWLLALAVICAGLAQWVFVSEILPKWLKEWRAGKTAAARRRVYLSDKAAATIEARLKRFDGPHLFPQNEIDHNKPAETDSYDIFHREAIAQTGFNFRLYDCRHTFATRALQAGTDLVTLAAIIGHASLKMVMRYAHPSEELK